MGGGGGGGGGAALLWKRNEEARRWIVIKPNYIIQEEITGPYVETVDANHACQLTKVSSP